MHIRNYYIVICLCILFTSCKDEVKTTLPFEEEKIINFLGDIHFAKSAAIIHKIDIRDSMRHVYESQVYKIHSITEEQHKELVTLLESDLNLYLEIEKKVHQHLKNVQNDKKGK